MAGDRRTMLTMSLLLLPCWVSTAAKVEVPFDVARVDELTKPDPLLKEECGGYFEKASRGAGAGYAWCNKIYNDPDIGKKYIGLSYGVERWDTWSKYLADVGVKTHLYDCFSHPHLFRGYLVQYKRPPTRYNICLGPKDDDEEGGWLQKTDKDGNELPPSPNNMREYRTYTKSLNYAGATERPAMSIFVKIDIEGSEWAVLETMSDVELQQILMLDFEYHWCMMRHDIKLDAAFAARVTAQLERLTKFFRVATRFADFEEAYEKAGCPRNERMKTMMSVTYVNKLWIPPQDDEALIGREH